ncbi:MAG: hypothetical protein M1592_05910 [Candidatus Thermoplasmatota archaeon]|jgi:hypothetical protein|nr:hypothetical protein [Candidatus Thermoplasmatota archaeon]
MNQKRPGRPIMGKFKTVIRNVSSDPEIEKFLGDHPEINASDVFRNAMHNLMRDGTRSSHEGRENVCRR